MSCCVVEPIVVGTQHSKESIRLSYRDATLYEDWLNASEVHTFISSLAVRPTVVAEGIELSSMHRQWQIEQLPFMNHYMKRAGYVVSFDARTDSGAQSSEPLLARNQPYYPDVFSAAQDWLNLREYHGESDGRNAKVMFLFPADDAFFGGALPITDGHLTLEINGSQAQTLNLAVVGAAWVSGQIFHLSADVFAGRAVISLPEDADRLELYLIDEVGKTFDFHKESKTVHSLRTFLQTPSVPKTDRVRKAIEEGEGKNIEFKPFFYPEQPLIENKKRTKLSEVLAAVAAFANTDGGAIYIGVDDDCQIVGIDQDLLGWGKAEFSPALVGRYVGALRSAIRDNIQGELSLKVSPASTDAGTVIVIDVGRSVSTPVNVKDNPAYYVRSNASNRKLPPSLWPTTMP